MGSSRMNVRDFSEWDESDVRVRPNKKGSRPRTKDRPTFKEAIREKWINTYKNRDIMPGFSTRYMVTGDDEWLCEAYMETDYTTLTHEDFQQTVNDYLAYLVKTGNVYEI